VVPLLLAAAAACSDGVGPGGVESVRVMFALQGPAAVSEAETTALESAFDRIDAYDVVVADSADGAVILSGSFEVVAAGSDAHLLSIELPGSAAGRAVLATIVGRDGGVELYRAAGHATVQLSLNPTPVLLPLRYTGPGLRGTIVDADGFSLGAVTVELFQGASLIASVTTEEDGTYLFLPASEGGVLTPGSYQVQPLPPGQYVCPAVRGATVTSTSAIVASFTAQNTPCGVDLLVLSGGDVDDTEAVAATFAQTPNVATQTFFFVNELPGLTYLSQFDVVLLLANGQFNESVSLGSQIESYVQAGGNLVVATFYWQNRSDSNLGSAGWGTLESIDPFESEIDPTTGVGGATYQAATLGEVVTGDAATGDALVQGLATLSSTGFRGGVAAAPGATVVAEWSDGQPLIGYRILEGGQRLVAISLFPASGTAASGDTQALWENAVRWTGEAGGP
ncbi:MAG TPA: carboxypeptidase-like regulatory domain-containing protein, partial [Longimicrobiales bacterium]|nr:carboxypeptidase-like regulatory domain-containing protein [Longimicrobiales bacterium]